MVARRRQPLDRWNTNKTSHPGPIACGDGAGMGEEEETGCSFLQGLAPPGYHMPSLRDYQLSDRPRLNFARHTLVEIEFP